MIFFHSFCLVYIRSLSPIIDPKCYRCLNIQINQYILKNDDDGIITISLQI